MRIHLLLVFFLRHLLILIFFQQHLQQNIDHLWAQQCIWRKSATICSTQQKTLASCLQNPTRAAWTLLGRLVGYLRFGGEFGLKMIKTKKGSTFAEVNLSIFDEKQLNQLEVYSDSDWSGGGDMKPTSSAVHILNGIIVHSTSRSQKCISLSSTEAEWYAASASVCDAYYLHHIVEFMTDGCCDTLILHTDNSAVRMLSLKFGAGRLRHIRGRMLWLQQKMSNHELIIRQVPTLDNIADLNTKGHGKHRFLCLMYLFGFVTAKGARVGEDDFAKFQAKQTTKQHVKLIGQSLKDDVNRNGCPVSNINNTAKRVLRVLSTCSLLQLGDSHAESPMIPGALGQHADGGGVSSLQFWLCAAMCLICGLAGFGFLVARGAIRFGNRAPEAPTAVPLALMGVEPQIPVPLAMQNVEKDIDIAVLVKLQIQRSGCKFVVV